MRFLYRILTLAGSSRAQKVLGAATLAGLVATVAIGLFVVPPDATQGDVQRLMYVHVPAAWVTFLAFGIVFLASVAYLKTGHIRWDRIAAAAAEIGVQFCALTILLGSLWGRPVWGTWWTWDPRLTTTAVLLLIYVGYLSLRRVADSPARRAKWSAVVGVVGFIDVPIVHLSVVWWRSLHQQATVLRLGAPTIAGSMLATLLLAFVTFSLGFGYLMAVRLRVGRLEDRTMGPVSAPSAPRARRPQPAGGAPEAGPQAAGPPAGGLPAGPVPTAPAPTAPVPTTTGGERRA
jgi:heme exporter protein C